MLSLLPDQPMAQAADRAMIIVGAGMAGLLAANMLAHRKPKVLEAQHALPNNHSAVLRFRTSQIGDITRIPFRKVTMIKCTEPWRNPVADALAYSFKNTGQYRSDRSITSHTIMEDRYIAPPNLIQLMAANATIQYNTSYKFDNKTQPIISTIPMPQLMKVLDYPGPKPAFTHNSGSNLIARIKDCDAYISLLTPDPRMPFSRISVTGDEITVECYHQVVDLRGTLQCAAHSLGIPFEQFYSMTRREQRYAKINPIDDDARKAFMFWATDRHNIYSLGRFATWRPHLLLDDLVKDIRLIDSWISNSYSLARHR